MAATVIPEQAVLGPHVREGSAQMNAVTMTASDATNMNKIVMSTGRCLVIFQNADAVNTEWVTVLSSDDPHGRKTDITQQSLPASSWAAYIFEPPGWQQTLGGKDLLIDSESTDCKILAIPL